MTLRQEKLIPDIKDTKKTNEKVLEWEYRVIPDDTSKFKIIDFIILSYAVNERIIRC